MSEPRMVMAFVAGPFGNDQEVEMVVVESVGREVLLTLDDCTVLSLDRAELLAAISVEKAA